MLDCVCAYALWNGMVRMDTWVARDVWMCAAMRVRARACMSAWHACVLCHLCACAHALVYGAHVMGAAPATARDADQAFAVDINVRTTTRTFASSSLHGEMHMLAHVHVLCFAMMGLHLSRSAMRCGASSRHRGHSRIAPVRLSS